MGGPLDDLADKWFALCDPEGSGQVYLSLALRAQMRLEEAGGDDAQATKDKLVAMKPGEKVARDVFLNTVNHVVASSGKEAQVGRALQDMIKDIELLGPPPAETGDTVRDIHAYRTYHGLDKALGYLLQSLITKEPADPVEAMIEQMHSMPRLAELRQQYPDTPYAQALS